MKFKFSVFATLVVLGVSMATSALAETPKDDPTVSADANAALTRLKAEAASSNAKDKSKELHELVENYVKAMKKAYGKVEKDEAKLQKDQKKLRAEAEDLNRRADNLGPEISNAQGSKETANHNVAVADLVEHMYKTGEVNQAQ